MNRILTSKKEQPLSVLLTWFTVLAVFAILAVIITVYTIGSYRSVQDSVQIIIVKAIFLTATFGGTASVWGIVLNSWYMFRRREKKYIKAVIIYILLFVLGFALALAASFVLAAVKGNAGGKGL